MENFLNTLNEKILIIDYTGKILFLNKSLLIQLGYKPNEIINKNILSLTFTKDINAFLLKDTPLKNKRLKTDLTATIASNGDFLKINEGWIKLLGYTKEELLSMNLLTLPHSNDKYKLHDLFSGNLDSISTITDLCIRLITKNNCIKWLNWNCSYINSDNVIMFTGKDITDKKELEIEKNLWKSHYM